MYGTCLEHNYRQRFVQHCVRGKFLMVYYTLAIGGGISGQFL